MGFIFKNIIIIDKKNVENIYIKQAAADDNFYTNIEGNIAKYIYITINDISVTDKLELVDTNGNLITKTDTKGNKEQFFNFCIQHNASKISITGLFSLGDDGKLYLDNYDLIRCNITATDSTVATNATESTAATNVAPGNNESITPTKLIDFKSLIYTLMKQF